MSSNILIHPDNISYSGPWLINYEKLLDLEKIIEEGWKKLTNYNSQKIKTEVKKEVKIFGEDRRESIEERIRESYNFKTKKEIIIYFKNGNKLIGNSFSGIAKDPHIRHEIPKGFIIELEAGRNNIKLEIRWKSNDSMEFTIKSEKDCPLEDIFFNINKWIKSLEPTFWIKYWKKLNFLQIGFIFLLIPYFLQFFQIQSSQKLYLYKQKLFLESYKLLNNGIDSTEINRSIEILLSLESNYVPNNFIVLENQHVDLLSYVIFFFVVAFFLISFFPPRTHIGLGKGEDRVKCWNTWIRIIFVLIPSFFIIPILINLITQK